MTRSTILASRIAAGYLAMVASSLAQMTVLSVLFGVVATISGLVLSFFLDVPSGSTIVLVQAVLFIAAALIGRAARPRRPAV